ncbi:MAG: hypothetical protein ABEJ03_01955 [Candidatus Nanohaloarchaea archaeon]
MKKVSALTILTVAFAATATSQYNGDGLSEFASSYNDQTDQVPGFVADIVGGETINVNLNASGDISTVGVDMDGVRITNVSEGGFSEPTLIVNASMSAINSTLRSDSPYSELEKQIQSGGISYSSTTTGGKVKLALVDAVRSILSLF